MSAHLSLKECKLVRAFCILLKDTLPNNWKSSGRSSKPAHNLKADTGVCLVYILMCMVPVVLFSSAACPQRLGDRVTTALEQYELNR